MTRETSTARARVGEQSAHRPRSARVGLLRAVLVLLAPFATATLASSSAVAATPTCDGKPAVIVSQGGFSGTDKQDVVIYRSRGGEVRLHGGDDKLCVESEAPPVRLFLGEDALALVADEMDHMKKEIADWRPVSLSTSFA